MPEGDTIFRTATTLRAALVGEPLVSFQTPRRRGPSPAPGSVVTAVEARGKHLLVRFDDDLVLHTHLRMSGSWHVYRSGERWWRPREAARAILETRDAVAVCFRAPVVEILDARSVRSHPVLSALGPDLCSPDADLDEVLARIERLPPRTEIADALLDQRVACGVGNVYKSETLFACGTSPFATIADLDTAARRAIFARAADLLRRNLAEGPRATYEGGLAVYARARRPCRRCGRPVRSARQGRPPRTTYWCPGCQPDVPPRRPQGKEPG